jgi:tetratricopeptide (TPR) repeat protein
MADMKGPFTMDSRTMPVRRGSTNMEPMTAPRISLLGPLTRSEEVIQFERFRHQILIVEALRGLSISHCIGQDAHTSYPPHPWRHLQPIHFSDLIMDKVHEGCVLKCRTVVEPIIFGSLQVLVEEIDEGYKVMMASIHNYINERNAMEVAALFPIGREIWIRNPCVKSHEGRAMIRVEDPVNLKLRQTSREIERILEYGPTDAKGWKTKGNMLIKRGKVEEGLDAYNTGVIYAGGNSKLRASLHRKRATVLFGMGKYQAARREALSSLDAEKDDRTYLLLARILLELRSYRAALDYAFQILNPSTECLSLRQQLVVCVKENEEGLYNTISIAREAQENDHVGHADYVSRKIELRSGGIAGRGLFASDNVSAGTLLIASKAVLCVFVDEIAAQTMAQAEEEGKGLFDSIRDEFIDRVSQMVNNGSARRILQLAGGPLSEAMDVDLRRDDVYDTDSVYFVQDQIRKIVTKNSFGGAQRSKLLSRPVMEGEQRDVGGGAVFYAPSFCNHSCVPNATYFTIGDMMFVRANRGIEPDEEITIHYLYVDQLDEKERNETLERVWEFTCECELCEYEKSHDEVCASADNIARKALTFADTATVDAAVKKLLSARKKIYQLHRVSAPQINILTVLESPPPPLPAALARTLIGVLRELTKVLRQSSYYGVELIGPMNAEYHFLLRDYSHYERIGIAGLPALRVWASLMRSSKSPDASIVEGWLQEAQDSHDMLLGEGHFQYQHGKFIKEIESEENV